jgi:hypothetical protein
VLEEEEHSPKLEKQNTATFGAEESKGVLYSKSNRKIETDNRIVKERLGLENIKELDDIPI